ncbi:MAG: hypothetical protein JSS20_19400, partial [Proteobacteria bacterium]|nr:hypothetical protein [Pseudomonadota bacterium]
CERVRNRLRARFGDECYEQDFSRVQFRGIRNALLQITIPASLRSRWSRGQQRDALLLTAAAVWPDMTGLAIRQQSFVEPRRAPAVAARDAGVWPRLQSATRILSVVAKHYGISESDILSARRHRTVTLSRSIGIYLCVDFGGCTLADTGRFFGGRDRTSALLAFRKIKGLLATDPALQAEIEGLKRSICDPASG